MIKLYLLLISSITFTSQIFNMEIQKTSTCDNFPYELKKTILLDLATNIQDYAFDNPASALGIMYNISLINQDLYQELNKKRNDPVVARDIIKKLSITSGCCVSNLIEIFKTRTIKKCIALSEQLYNNNLNPEKIQQLFDQGAFVDYKGSTYDGGRYVWKKCVLDYWTEKNINNMKKLLELGADPNQDTILSNALQNIILHNDNYDKIKIILSYKPTFIPWKQLLDALDQQRRKINLQYSGNEIFDLFLLYSPINTLNNGLRVYLRESKRSKKIIKKFIDHGADPSVALNDVLKTVPLYDYNGSTSRFIKIFNLISSQKTFNDNEKILDTLKNIQQTCNSLIDTIENNSPK